MCYIKQIFEDINRIKNSASMIIRRLEIKKRLSKKDARYYKKSSVYKFNHFPTFWFFFIEANCASFVQISRVID